MIKTHEVKKVHINELKANEYNPNKMPLVEMDLLRKCICEFGFLFPIITYKNEDKYIIIDGYHRYHTLKEMGSEYAWVIDLEITKDKAIQLTILMNRIKGMHKVDLMSDIIVRLEDLGLSEKEISKNLGMEREEVLRLKNQKGIASVFSNHEYSKSWEV